MLTDRLSASALIGSIYDAALDPALWPDVLPRVTRFIGGPSAGLWSEDSSAAKRVAVYRACGFEAEYVDAYVTRYGHFDPSTSAFVLAKIGEPFARSQVEPDDAFFQTRFFREWQRPQGLMDCTYVVLYRRGLQTTLFAVSQRKGDRDAGRRVHGRMRLIVPHLRRAVLIGRTMDIENCIAASIENAFDRLSTAMFLVDAAGRFVHASAGGRDLLSSGDVLTVTRDRLFAADSAGDKALQEALAAANSGDLAVGVQGISLLLMARGGEEYVARVLPLAARSGHRLGQSASVALFVRKADLPSPSQPALIARRYRLTPMELRVLLAVASTGGGVANIAEVLGVSSETIKTHLSHIYGKTGVNRQVNLVKLVLRFSAQGLG
jgi:DNA-binding CsgD family transcriptional regulator